MKELEALLLVECRKIAFDVLLHTFYAEGSNSKFDEADCEKLTQDYFMECRKAILTHCLGLEDYDPNIVLRAVRYLATQAIYPRGKAVGWFRDGLSILLSLTCPTSGVPKEAKPIFDDIRRGLNEAEAQAKILE